MEVIENPTCFSRWSVRATTVKTRPFDIQAMTGNKPSTQSNSNIIGGNNLDNGRNNQTNK